MKVPIYPKLVKTFSENLRINIDAIGSTVKDTLIVIDERRLSSILEMPRLGVCVLALEKKINDLKDFREICCE